MLVCGICLTIIMIFCWIVLTPKGDHKIEPLYVMVTGYVVPRNSAYNGFGIKCYVNENCRQQGRDCVKLMKKLLGVTDD